MLKLLQLLIPAGALLLSLSAAAQADLAGDARARLDAGLEGPRSFTFAPISLEGGSRLTLVSPTAWRPLSRRLAAALTAAHADYTRVFGAIPPLSTSIQLMEEEAFFAESGAPRWTNALFFRGRITIPVSVREPLNFDNLVRSVRHEYAHAVVNALSGGRCPGWLDEGLAQWAEGTENPALRPALRQWLERHAPVPLRLLQGGFTKLDPAVVPAAYAQSLYMTRVMIETFRFALLRRYFDRLRDNEDKDTAFSRAFGVSTEGFETRAAPQIQRWSATAPRRAAG